MSAEADEIRARIIDLEDEVYQIEEAEDQAREAEEEARAAAEKCKAQADTAELRAALLELSKLGVVTYNAVLTPEMETIEGAALVALKACVEWMERSRE